MIGFPPLKRPFHKTAKDADVGRPDRRLKIVPELLVCNECEEEVELRGAPGDKLVWCENCQMLEGGTFSLSASAVDDCDCSMGDDGATPTRCRQCEVRGRLGL